MNRGIGFLCGYTTGAKPSLALCLESGITYTTRCEDPARGEAEKLPYELDQDNTCVRNVLPLLFPPFLPSSLSPFPSPIHLLCFNQEADFSNLLTTTALGSGILFTYPEIATICGVQGLIVYALSSALPLLIFGYLGPIIRRRCPEGFVLTEWTRQRYGAVTGLFLSLCT